MKGNGQVYVMGRDDGSVKVGYSVRPRLRRSQLRGNPTLLFETDYSFVNARRVEKMAHRLLELAGKRIGKAPRDEWFHATLDEACAAIERAERIAAGLEPEPPLPERPVGELFNMRLPAEHLRWLDEMRRKEEDIPNRSEMARRCIERQAREAGVVERTGGKRK